MRDSPTGGEYRATEQETAGRQRAERLFLRRRQLETAPNHDAIVRPRLKLAAHQGPVCINAALCPASNVSHQRRTAIAVAPHAPVVEIDQIIRNAFAIAIANKRRPGVRVGAACAAGEAVNGHQGPAFFMR